ncbi:hypothetical protein C8J57DRAFT_1518642 [Mycena rebaudengoi]|nr:hypothetical protein C8J57DRAFT_1518642 [Mycena rebaudengoi]
MGLNTLSDRACEKDTKQQHDELMALLNAHPDLSSSDRSSVIRTLLSSGNSSGSFSLLPASPKIFHGCESELKDDGQCTPPEFRPHCHPQWKPSIHMYFVPCHSSPTYKELAATIADHIGLEKGSNMAKKIAHHFAHTPPSFLVLDNLETPWEPLSSRSEVEEFLSLLTNVPHLGLIVCELIP